MTMICPAKNKAELKEKLDAGCTIDNPTPWGNDPIDSKREEAWPSAEPVVLDPLTRRRFATIQKLADGTWRVK